MVNVLVSFNNLCGFFVYDDFYVFVVNLENGKFEVYGMNFKWIGINVSDLYDVEGCLLVKEMMELVKIKGEGIVDYVWCNLVINVVEKKCIFVCCENGSLIGVGFYSE